MKNSNTKDITNVDLFLFDLDGTIYLGDKEIEGSYDAVKKLRALGKQICFFTNNSSRKHTDYIEKLCGLGLGVSYKEVLTSGQITCEYILENFNNSKVFLVGNERLKEEFRDYGIELDEENPDICVLGFDTTLTYDKLYRFCKFLNKGLPYIATHPDYFCPADDCPMPDNGAFIEAIRLTLGRKPDLIMGKPKNTAGGIIEKRYNLPAQKIAMVGDRLYTDIAFGKNCDFVSVLVLSGETTKEMASSSEIQADYTLGSVKDILKLLSGMGE